MCGVHDVTQFWKFLTLSPLIAMFFSYKELPSQYPQSCMRQDWVIYLGEPLNYSTGGPRYTLFDVNMSCYFGLRKLKS